MPGGHRRHDMPYPPMPPNMRPQPGYPYYAPQMGPPMPPYSQHYPQQWYQYPQHMQHHPPAATPRQYQHHPPPQHGGHYAPLIVSSYPQAQILQNPTHVPPPFAQQAPAPAAIPSPVPVKEPFSPAPPSISSSTNIQAETPPSTASTPSELVSNTPAPLPVAREPFYPPVSNSVHYHLLTMLTTFVGALALSRRQGIPRSSSASETQSTSFISLQRADSISISSCGDCQRANTRAQWR
jgi:hypothetical protein